VENIIVVKIVNIGLWSGSKLHYLNKHTTILVRNSLMLLKQRTATSLLEQLYNANIHRQQLKT